MPIATTTEKRWFIQNLATVHVGGAATDGAYGLVELVAAEGDMPPLHVHRRESEAFYVLEGRMTVYAGAERWELAEGDCLLAPKDVPHTYRVESERARWLALAAPAGFEQFVVDASEPAEADELPPSDRAVDPDRLGRLAAEHGIELLGPPGMLPA